MTDITPEQIAEIEALLAKATPGPWQHHLSHVYGADPERALVCQFRNGPWLVSDRDLIVALFNAAPSLILAAKERDRLKAENERLHNECAQAWRERNIAHAKVKAWEDVVYVENLPLEKVK